jgi:hypothetical protein
MLFSENDQLVRCPMLQQRRGFMPVTYAKRRATDKCRTGFSCYHTSTFINIATAFKKPRAHKGQPHFERSPVRACLSYTLVLDDNWPSRRTAEKLGAKIRAN